MLEWFRIIKPMKNCLAKSRSLIGFSVIILDPINFLEPMNINQYSIMEINIAVLGSFEYKWRDMKGDRHYGAKFSKTILQISQYKY